MSAPVERINLHAFLPRSRANGPGWRSVVWFQGCILNCPGCFNPQTHERSPRQLIAVDELARQCVSQEGIEGVTISGGEPFLQPRGLLRLLAEIRRRSTLSVVLFSGHTLPEIEAMPDGPAILALVDALVAGRYDSTQPCADGLRSSANQRAHRLTERHSAAELEAPPVAEVIVSADGSVTMSGLLARRR
jgi:anaerobic ribonucleoside-triphosphate reductase activating protein